MKRLDIALLFAVVFSVCAASFSGFAADCDAVRQNTLRLHILANSDSAADQELKLAVRDRILENTEELFESPRSLGEAETAARNHLADIEAAARAEIGLRGYDYPVKAEVVNMYFTTRRYDNVTLPAGRYDAVRVEIGAAEGKNWWCVLFPPLCVPAATPTPAEPLREQIENLGKTPQYIPKFAVVELAESIKEKLGR